MAAPTLIGSQTAVTSVASGGSAAASLPTGGQAGDTVLLAVAAYGTSLSVTISGGWTQVTPGTLDGTLYMRTWAAPWSAGLTATLTSTAPDTRWLAHAAVLIRGGAAPTDWVIGTVAKRSETATPTTVLAPGVPIQAAESLVISLFGERTSANEADISSITGATKYLFLPQTANNQETITIGQSVENGTTVTEVRRNKHPNPSVGADVTGWSSWLSGGAYTSSRQTSGGPGGVVGTWWRGVVTTAPTGSPAMIHTRGSGTNGIPVTAGTTYTLSAYAIASRAPSSGVRIDVQWYTSNGTSISTTSSTTNAMTAGVWQRVSYTGAAPANAAFARPSVAFSGPQGVWVANDTYGATAVLVEQAGAVDDYFDGNATVPGYVTSWAGTANASESILSTSGTSSDAEVTYPNGNSQEVRRNLVLNPKVGVDTSYWNLNPAGASTTSTRQGSGGPTGIASWYRLYFNSAPSTSPAAIHATSTGTSALPVTTGLSYTASGYVYSTKAGLTGVRTDITWYNSSGASLSTSSGTTTTIAASTWERRSVTATAPAGAAYARVSMTFSGPVGVIVNGDHLGATGILLEQASSLGTYFDGGYTTDSGVTPSWTGTTDDSESILSSLASAGGIGHVVAIAPLAVTNPGYPVQVQTAGGLVEKRVYRQSAGGPVTPQNLIHIPAGYDTVADMLTREPYYIADRGGQVNWPEVSLYAYTQSVIYKAGALEIPVNRTSDGVWFGLLDATLDRASGITGNIDPTTLTWAQVQAYTIAPPVGFTGAPQPYMRLEDMASTYGNTHVLFLDPRFREADHRTEFLDTITALFPPNKIVVKHYHTYTSLAAAAKARGLATYGYYSQSDIDADPNVVTNTHANWDILGLGWDATTTAWNALKAPGKPTVAHNCTTEEAGEIGLGKGANGLMMREVVNTIQAKTPILPSPARIYAKHPFSSTSFWNMPLHSGVTYSSVGDVRVTGTKGIRTLNGTINYQADWDLAIWQATASSPLVQIKAPRYSYPTWPAAGITHRVPASGVVPGPDGDGSYNVEYDGWVTIVDPEGKLAIDLYKAKWLTPGVTLQAAYAYQYPLDSVGGTDASVGTPAGDGLKASNWPYMGGTLRVWEMNDAGTPAASRIKHALSLSIPRANLKPGYIWPARGEDYGSVGGTAQQVYSGDIPMGTCFALPPSYDIESAGLTDHGKALAYALKNYGAWVGDASSSATLYMEMNTPSNLGIDYNDAWDVLRYQLVAVDGRTSTNPGGTGTPIVPLTDEGIFGPVS